MLLVLSPGTSAGPLDLQSRRWNSACYCHLLLLALTPQHVAAHFDWLFLHVWRLPIKICAHWWCMFLHKKHRDRNHTHLPTHLGFHPKPLIGRQIASPTHHKSQFWSIQSINWFNILFWLHYKYIDRMQHVIKYFHYWLCLVLIHLARVCNIAI